MVWDSWRSFYNKDQCEKGIASLGLFLKFHPITFCVIQQPDHIFRDVCFAPDKPIYQRGFSCSSHNLPDFIPGEFWFSWPCTWPLSVCIPGWVKPSLTAYRLPFMSEFCDEILVHHPEHCQGPLPRFLDFLYFWEWRKQCLKNINLYGCIWNNIGSYKVTSWILRIHNSQIIDIQNIALLKGNRVLFVASFLSFIWRAGISSSNRPSLGTWLYEVFSSFI